MGDVIDFLEYKRKKELAHKEYDQFMSELERLGVWTVIWTPYDITLEKQKNPDWMDMFYYPDKDW